MEQRDPGLVGLRRRASLRRDQIAATHWVIHGLNHYIGGTWDYNVSGVRTLSAWVKSTAGPEFIVTVETTAGLRPLRYQWNGTPTAAPYAWTGATPNVPLFGCGFTADGVWHRLERNLAADAAAAYPGETLLRVRGMTFNAYTQDLYLDDVRLSNAMTVEHNTMGPGVIGHILRVTQTDPTTYAQAHRWLHYDQVGSVLSESDATGNLAQRHEQDTFGNTLSSWQSGLVGGDRAGWHHNTKEWDGDIGMVYMFQRWYSPGVGSFASRAPFPPAVEPEYQFAGNNPLQSVDPRGLEPNDPRYGKEDGFWEDWEREKRRYGRKGHDNIDGDETDERYREWEELGKPGKRKVKPWKKPPTDCRRFTPDPADLYPLNNPFPVYVPDPAVVTGVGFGVGLALLWWLCPPAGAAATAGLIIYLMPPPCGDPSMPPVALLDMREERRGPCDEGPLLKQVRLTGIWPRNMYPDLGIQDLTGSMVRGQLSLFPAATQEETEDDQATCRFPNSLCGGDRENQS